MQRVALAAIDLADHRREAVSSKQAHAFFTHMRDAHGATMWQQDLHDLTDSNAFNWRGYLANRPGMEALLRGAHVWQFAFVWTWDPNRRQHRGETSSPASPTAATYGCTLDSAARLTPSRASGSIGFSTRCRTEAKWTRRRGP